MKFRDEVKLYLPTKSIYGQSVAGASHTVKAIVEQTSGMTRGGGYDALTGDARAYLDGSDSWLTSLGYLIEGYYLSVNLYGIEQVYRVTNMAIGRAVVTDGRVQHIEVDLERVNKKAPVPAGES